VAFKCGLVRGVVEVLLGVSVDGSEWRVSAVVAVGEIGCRYERESFEKLDFFSYVIFRILSRGGWQMLQLVGYPVRSRLCLLC